MTKPVFNNILEKLAISLMASAISLSAMAEDTAVLDESSKVKVSVLEFTSPQFYWDEAKRKVKGEVGDLFQCALDRVDFEYTLKVYPTSRQHHLMATSQLDVAFAWQQTEERDLIGTFALPVKKVMFGVLTTRDDITDMDSLEGLTISAPRKSNWIEFLRKYKVDIDESYSYESAIMKAIHGRTDGAIFAQAAIQGKEIEPAKFVPIDEYAIGFYVANLSPRRDDILFALNQAITSCTKDSDN